MPIFQCIWPLFLLLAAGQQGKPAAAAAQPKPPLADSASATFEIAGTVVDAISGDPLSGAFVRVSAVTKPEDADVARTDDDGHFSFTALPAGKYRLFARKKGFEAQDYLQHGSFSSAVVTGPHSDTQNIVFALQPEARITGQVVDEFMEPVREATVTLFRKDTLQGRLGTHFRITTQTNDEGSYHFNHLRAGTFFVMVSAQPWFANHAPLPRTLSSDGHPAGPNADDEIRRDPVRDVVFPITYFTGATDPAQATPIVLQPGDRQTADVRLTLEPALHLRLSNTGDDPNQWPQLRVTESAFDNFESNLFTSIEQVSPGVYELSGLPPGQLNVYIDNTADKQGASRLQQLDVTSNGVLSATDGVASAVVSGEAIMEGGFHPPRDAQIQLRGSANQEWHWARLEPDGQFSFQYQFMKPGKYTVEVANARGLTVSSLSATGATVDHNAITIAGSGEIHLKLMLSKGEDGVVRGAALRDGKPAVGVMVALISKDASDDAGPFRIDQSDSDGSFELASVRPGSYTAIALADAWDFPWATPGVLTPFLAHGESIDVASGGHYYVQLKVQLVPPPPPPADSNQEATRP